jgi:hypothetical protein
MLIGCKKLGIAVSQVEDFFKVGLEYRKIVLCPGFCPGFMSSRGDQGKFLHPFKREPGFFFIVSPGHPDQTGII